MSSLPSPFIIQRSHQSFITTNAAVNRRRYHWFATSIIVMIPTTEKSPQWAVQSSRRCQRWHLPRPSRTRSKGRSGCTPPRLVVLLCDRHHGATQYSIRGRRRILWRGHVPPPVATTTPMDGLSRRIRTSVMRGAASDRRGRRCVGALLGQFRIGLRDEYDQEGRHRCQRRERRDEGGGEKRRVDDDDKRRGEGWCDNFRRYFRPQRIAVVR